MRILVNILPECRNELLTLLTARTDNLEDAVNLTEVYLDGASDLLRQHGGPPSSALILRTRRGRTYWWLYTNGVWLAFTSEDKFGSLLGGRTRTITLVASVERPPTP